MIDVRILELSIKALIETLIEGQLYDVYQGEKREIQIHTGMLPPDPEETIIPAITIRTIKGKNSLMDKILTVIVSIGIFDKNAESGYIKISELTQKIFDTLLKVGILENRFEILPEAEWSHPETQPYPYYLGFIKLNVTYEKDYREDYKDWLDGGE